MNRIVPVVALLLMYPSSGFAADDELRYRDWQVEKPFQAGVWNGLSMGFFPSSKFGEGRRVSEFNDLYAVSGSVHEQMVQVSEIPYQLGTGLGVSFWISVVFAGIYRLLNKLIDTDNAVRRVLK